MFYLIEMRFDVFVGRRNTLLVNWYYFWRRQTEQVYRFLTIPRLGA